MRVLQIGYPKSGNYWLWKILDSIFLEAGLERKSFIQTQPFYPVIQRWPFSFPEQGDIDCLDIRPRRCFYRVEPYLTAPVENLRDYLDQTTHVWTHSGFNPGSLEALPYFDKIVYLVRDPRDTVVSFAHFVHTPYAESTAPAKPPEVSEVLRRQLGRSVQAWVQHVGAYLCFKEPFRIHFVFYERLLSSFEEELSRLLKYLEIDLGPKGLEEVRTKSAYETMKWSSPRHVRRGRAGEWREELTPSQKEEALRLAGPMLQLLNYPLGEEEGPEDSLFSPALPDPLDRARIDEAVKHSNDIGFFCGAHAAGNA